MEDHRRRPNVEAGHRRTAQKLLGGRGGGFGVEPRRGLHRHGRDRVARQHHAGRRHLQIHRRRQDLEARRACRTRRPFRAFASILPIPTSCMSRRWAILTARTHERGVFRTKDGGKTWKKVCIQSDRAGAVDLCMDPHNPNVLFAAIWDVYRTPWSLSSGGPRSGLFKSTDGGDTWTEITRNPGLPTGIIGKIGVTVSGGGSAIAFTRSWRRKTAACIRPTTAARPGRRSAKTARSASALSITRASYADPKERDTVYVMNTAFFKSIDGGKTYQDRSVPHGDNHDLWIASNDPKRMVNSNDGGANVSVNGGETWTRAELPDRAALSRGHDQRRPVSRVRRAAGQHDTVRAQRRRPRTCATRGAARAAGYTRWAAGKADTSRRIPKNPNLFYAGSQGALLTKYDRRDGHERDIQVYPLFFSGMPASDAERALAVDVPDRVLAARRRRCCTRRRSTCGGPRTTARAGRRSVRT